jgi:hypothetical protein
VRTLILAAVTPDNTPHGYNLTFAFPMLLFAISAVVLYLLFSRPHRRTPPERVRLSAARAGTAHSATAVGSAAAATATTSDATFAEAEARAETAEAPAADAPAAETDAGAEAVEGTEDTE